MAAGRLRQASSSGAEGSGDGGSGGAGGEAIVSPIDGVIASIDARPGAVVAPGEALVGVIDPARLSIEALAFEPVVAAAITRASVALRDGSTLQAASSSNSISGHR